VKKICAWCGKDLGIVESRSHSEDVITHGMCEACATRFTTDTGTTLHEFLDSLGVPVFLVEPEPRVRTGNKQARELLDKDLSMIEGQLGGDVIECIYAKQPHGCGNDVHCKSCTIRNTVLDTFATGKSSVRIPAYPDIQTPEGVQTIRFVISTEKVGERVLLRIDDVQQQEKVQLKIQPTDY